MAQAFSSHPSPVFTKIRHQDNMMASLSRRLESAKAANDLRLVALLEQERQQIGLSSVQEDVFQASFLKSLLSAFQTLGRDLVRAISGNGGLEVHEFTSGRDHWWYAFNPQNGKWVYADSEAELRLWIKENYQGS